MSFRLSTKSKRKLHGVHPQLVALFNRAIEITPIDFTVLEGLRSYKRQQRLYRAGKSKTLNSRHLSGHAVDIAPYVNGKISWHWPHYYDLEPAVWQAAKDVGLKKGDLEWGGHWKSFKDGPHWQLSWKRFPK